MANEGFHKPVKELSEETREMHLAIVWLLEEMEAVDWYNQRVDACKDAELKSILKHNADEKKQHAAMLLEPIRRVLLPSGRSKRSLITGILTNEAPRGTICVSTYLR